MLVSWVDCINVSLCMLATGDPLARTHNLLNEEDNLTQFTLPGRMTRSKQRALANMSVSVD